MSCKVASVHSRTVRTGRDGTLDLEEMKDKVRERNNMHYPITRLVCLENTHNRTGGTVLPIDYHRQVGGHAISFFFHSFIFFLYFCVSRTRFGDTLLIYRQLMKKFNIHFKI